MLVLTNTFFSLQAVQHNPLLLVVPVHCPDCRRAEVLRVWRPQWDPLQGGVGWASGDTPSHGGADTGGQDPVQECTDLINNRGCVKQFVNGGRRASLAVSSLSNTSLSCPLYNLINAL